MDAGNRKNSSKKEDDELFRSMSLEDLDKQLEELEEEERAFEEMYAALEGKIDSSLSSIRSSIKKTEESLELLRSFEKRSMEIKESLSDRVDDLEIGDLNGIDGEVSKMMSQIQGLFSIQDAPMEPVNPVPAAIVSDPVFRTNKIYRPKPGTKSPLKQYPVFRTLTRDEDLESYETLLRMRGIKIEILRLIQENVTGELEISRRLGSSLVAVEEGMNNLIEYGQISVDKKHLSGSSEKAVSLYGSIKSKAMEDLSHAALTIYPMVFGTDRRSRSQLERFLDIDGSTIDSATGLLQIERLVSISTGVGGEKIYSGKTPESESLRRSINGRYSRARL